MVVGSVRLRNQGYHTMSTLYQTLQVSKDATPAEIKRAFKILAKKYHPDVSSEANAEEQFKNINNAYAILSDPNKKAEYDISLDSSFQASGANTYHARNSNEDEFRYWTEQRNRVVVADWEISLEDVAHGNETTLKAEGIGNVLVKLPLGIPNGSVLNVISSTGDRLGLHIHYKPHDLFRTANGDLFTDIFLFPWEFVLGSKVEVVTLYGKIQVSVPANSTIGKTLRVPKKGLPLYDSGPMAKKGDLYIKLNVSLPAENSATALTNWKKLATNHKGQVPPVRQKN